MSGWVGRVADLFRNKDYYGVQIHDTTTTVAQTGASSGKYMGQTLLPFSIRGYKNLSANDVGGLRKAVALMGVQPAPRYIGQTPAERKTAEYWQGQRSEGGIRPDQLEHKQDKRMIVSQIEHGHAPNISQALAKGTIKPTDVKSLYQRASMGQLASSVLHMPLADAEKIYQSANLKERAVLEPVMAKNAPTSPNAIDRPSPGSNEKLLPAVDARVGPGSGRDSLREISRTRPQRATRHDGAGVSGLVHSALVQGDRLLRNALDRVGRALSRARRDDETWAVER
jgi:hypothetical protein